MSFLGAGGAPFGELRDENAILNFIFSNSPISFAPPPPPTVAGGAPAPADGGGRFDADLAAHRGWTAREAAAVAAAEEGRLADAKAALDGVLAEAPGRAPALNNRAQVLRLMGDAAGAAADLDAAVGTARAWLDAHAGSGHPLVGFHEKTLAAAHTQRAAARHAAGDADGEAADLAAAAALGSAIARMVATKVGDGGGEPSRAPAARPGGGRGGAPPAYARPSHSTPTRYHRSHPRRRRPRAVQPVRHHVPRGGDQDDGGAARRGRRRRGRVRRSRALHHRRNIVDGWAHFRMTRTRRHNARMQSQSSTVHSPPPAPLQPCRVVRLGRVRVGAYAGSIAPCGVYDPLGRRAARPEQHVAGVGGPATQCGAAPVYAWLGGRRGVLWIAAMMNAGVCIPVSTAGGKGFLSGASLRLQRSDK